MPTAAPPEKRTPIPAGDHILTLVAVEEKDFPSYNDPKTMTPRWIWQFKSQEKDPETGNRFEYNIFTGPNYGGKRAALTALLDMMLPDWSTEDKETLDTDDILNTKYEASIYHEKGDDGNPRPKHYYIKPARKKAGQVATKEAAKKADAFADEDDEVDPYADD